MLLAFITSSLHRNVIAFQHHAARATRPTRVIKFANYNHRMSTLSVAVPSYKYNTMARYMSTNPNSNQDYKSMKTTELRDILRARGLKVSGIKADLVERLESGVHRVGNKPKRVPSLENQERSFDTDIDKKSIPSNNNKKWVRREFPDDEDESGEENLDGLVNQLSSLERSSDGKDDDDAPAPSNLVFAKEGEDDSDSDEEWDSDEEEYDPNSTVGVPSSQVKPQQQQQQSRNKEDSKTQRLKEFQLKNSGNQIDFQGTRVFVQGLPEHATWKDLKDHFQQSIDGSEVVYASVSMDRDGISKQCGIVQFETPTMAKTAIREMRNFPLHGSKLYVREDVQESRRDGGGGRQKKENDSPPDEWKRANDETRDGGGKEWYILKDEELQEIEGLIELRDQHRKKRNYKMSDGIREQLKEDFGVHLDDRLKLWWTDTEHGGAPSIVSDIKGDGRWGSLKPWRQIPTTPENDALVDTDHVMMLLNKRDKARRRKDFGVADDLLQKAHDAAQGELGLRIHDESRTWRIWTERPPPKHNTLLGYEDLSPEEMCLKIVKDNEPDKVDEMRAMLRKFPGREWSVFKRLRGRYNARDE